MTSKITRARIAVEDLAEQWWGGVVANSAFLDY